MIKIIYESISLLQKRTPYGRVGVLEDVGQYRVTLDGVTVLTTKDPDEVKNFLKIEYDVDFIPADIEDHFSVEYEVTDDAEVIQRFKGKSHPYVAVRLIHPELGSFYVSYDQSKGRVRTDQSPFKLPGSSVDQKGFIMKYKDKISSELSKNNHSGLIKL